MYKKDFPIFKHRPDLIYFDNGASAQKCQVSLDAVQNFYLKSYSNIHRGPHFLAEESTILYEDARRTVADFIGAQQPEEVIFTRNSTESINLLAQCIGKTLQPGDVIITSELEHHANLVPWLKLKEEKGIELRYLKVSSEGHIEMNEDLFDEKVQLLAISGMSNVFGTITDLKPFIKQAHSVNAKVLVDGSQLAVHQPVNVHELNIDYFVFTGHKLYAPTGIGVLYGKKSLLENLPPFLVGGDMVQEVYLDRFTPADLPEKLEAGTPNVAGAIGLKAAIDYILSVGWNQIQKEEKKLTKYLLEKASSLPYFKILGSQRAENRGSILPFTIEGIHPHDIAEGLSSKNICIRAGQHCTQPLHDLLKIPASARMSLAFYNTTEEIDTTFEVIDEIYKYFN